MAATPANAKEVIIINTERLYGEPRSYTRPATQKEYEAATSYGGGTSAAVIQQHGLEKAKLIFDERIKAEAPAQTAQQVQEPQKPRTFLTGDTKTSLVRTPSFTPAQTAQQVQEPQKPRTFLTGDTKTSLVRTPSFQQSPDRPQEQPQDNRIDLNKNISKQVREHPLTQHFNQQYENARSIFEPKQISTLTRSYSSTATSDITKTRTPQTVENVGRAFGTNFIFGIPDTIKSVAKFGMDIAATGEDVARGNIKPAPTKSFPLTRSTAPSSEIETDIYIEPTAAQKQAIIKEQLTPVNIAGVAGSLVGGAALSKGVAALIKPGITTSIVKSDIIAKSVSGETKLASVTAAETKMPYPFRNIKTVSESQTITRAVPENMVTDIAGVTKEAGFIKQIKTDIKGKLYATDATPYTSRSIVSKETEKVISTRGTIQKGTAYRKFETYLGENKPPSRGAAILGRDLATTERNYIKTTESNTLFEKGHARNMIYEYTGDMKTMSGLKSEPLKPQASKSQSSFAEQAVSQQEQTLHQTAGAGAIAAHEELVTKITAPRIKAAQYSAQAPSIMQASISPYADTKSPSPFSSLTKKNPYAMTTVYKPSTVAATFQVGKLQTMTQSKDQMVDNIVKTKNIQAYKFAQQQDSIQKKMQGLRSGQTQGQIARLGQEQGSMFKQEQAQMQKQGQIQKQLQKQMNIARTNTLTRTMVTPKIKVPFVVPHLDLSKGARFIPQVPRVGFVPQFFMKGGGFKMGSVGFKEQVSAQSFAARESLRSKDIIGFKLVQAEAERYKSGMTKVNPSDMRMLFNLERGGFVEKPSSMNPSRLSSFNFAKFMNRKG
jgi:hypothetical protein